MFTQIFLSVLLKTESNKIGRKLFSFGGSKDLNMGTTRAILNRSGKYSISIHLLKIFDKGTEIESITCA